MKFERMSISEEEYIVLDVETNGLSSIRDDLLSISFYRPDNNATYNRFLPLELQDDVLTTQYNGIKKKDLKGLEPLSQEEIEVWFNEFQLDKRIILHYGGLDQKFIKAYFRRHRLIGYERMQFFNFKQLICGPAFSDGSMTKDNLCKMFGIEGITQVHSGENDCKLEWELFKKIGGRPLLATEGMLGTNYFVLNDDYIIPASYLRTHPNLGKLVERPYINCVAVKKVFEMTLKEDGMQKFPTNFNGVVIEHLINTLLGVEEIDNQEFLLKNKSKMEWVGRIASSIRPVPMVLNKDGTVTADEPRDKAMEIDINRFVNAVKKGIYPLIEYIQNDIFSGNKILSQELAMDKERGIMALCDLSSEDAILEIKTGSFDIEKFKEQLYYESAGRDVYILGMNWVFRKPNGELMGRDYFSPILTDYFPVDSVEFYINRVQLEAGEKEDGRKTRSETAFVKLVDYAAQKDVEIVDYQSSQLPILVKCKKCGSEWTTRSSNIRNGALKCKTCNPKPIAEKRRRESVKLSPEQKAERHEFRISKNAEKYAYKIKVLSEGKIVVDTNSYIGSKENVISRCEECGYIWTTRADHLLSRCWCPLCKKKA